jgi:hypothetical protein
MFGVVSLVARFLSQDLVLLAHRPRALSNASMLLERCSRCVPDVLTVRTEETPLQVVLIGKNGFGPAARTALDMNDVSEPRNGHGSI